MCGHTEWSGFVYNTLSIFTNKVNIKIPPHISWTLLTSRPIIDKPIIKLALKFHKLYPANVITADTIFYQVKDKQDVANWKFSILNLHLINQFVDAVVYVDDDSELRNLIPVPPKLILCPGNSLADVIREEF